ncbi:MAG: hypothetical protein K2K53_05060, partial [Oscillospiraceae bacterium]|nr:hypothetical protein [Oscillospiraceae bacterium]
MYYSDGSLGTLKIPSIGLTVGVYEGTDSAALLKGAGHFKDTSIHKYIEGTANEPLAGVAFKVVDGSGAAVGTSDGVYYTNTEGDIKVTGIEPGTTVTVREVKTVEGFVLDGTPKTVKVTAGQPAPELTFWNKRTCSLT